MARTPIFRTALLCLSFLLMVASGCARPQSASCIDNTDCDSTDGGVQACLGGECRDVQCLRSSDCPIANYCSDSYSCELGCQEDADCRSGEACNTETNVCEPHGCRSTVLDCYPGQFCEEGSCVDAVGAYCETCTGLGSLCRGSDGAECNCQAYDAFFNPTGCRGDQSLWEIVGDSDCGGSGNFCLNSASGALFCGVDCSTGQECPAFYTCIGIQTDTNGDGIGDTIIGQNCVADCSAL